MAAQGTCPDCGKRYKFKDDKLGRTIQCKECGGSIIVVSAASSFKRSERSDRVQAPVKLTSIDRTDVLRSGLRGVSLLLLSYLLNLASWAVTFLIFVMLATGRGSDSFSVFPSLIGFLALASSAAMVCGLACWVSVSARIERREVVLGSLGIQSIILLVHVLAMIRNGLATPPLVSGFLGTLNWASFVMLTTVLQKLSILADRIDIRDTAEETVRYGVGVIVFGFVAGAAAVVPLPGFGAVAMFSMLGTLLSMLFWFPNYTRLLFWLRSAIVDTL